MCPFVCSKAQRLEFDSETTNQKLSVPVTNSIHQWFSVVAVLPIQGVLESLEALLIVTMIREHYSHFVIESQKCNMQDSSTQ